jgi:hypothetical protein
LPSQQHSRKPSLLARCYLWTDRFTGRALRALDAAHKGVWLGLLDRDDLDVATLAMYAHSDSYRDDAWNLSGFSYWEQAMVERYFGSVRRAFVLAAGGGREVIALSQRGIRAEGFEPDASFVAAGQRLIAERGFDASLSRSEPSSLPELEGRFDGAIVGWGLYTHMAGRRARVAFLRQVAAALEPGSPVLLSFFGRGKMDRTLEVSYRVARLSSLLRPGREPVLRGDSLKGGYFHHFDEQDIEAETGEAGLELLHYGTHPYGHAVARVTAARVAGASEATHDEPS